MFAPYVNNLLLSLAATMPGCVVSVCQEGSGGKKIEGQTFPFPPKEKSKLRQKWIEQINRENWTPSSSSRVCYKHFPESAYSGAHKRSDANTLFSCGFYIC